MRRASRKRSVGKAAKSARSARLRHLALQPDALGVATRLAAARLREAGIVLKPLLQSAGLSAGQINRKDLRIGVASQIRFLELAAKALNDPVLGFRLARDGCRFVADARRCPGPGPALQFDRQCWPRSQILRSAQFDDRVALRRRDQAFRSATDGMFGHMAGPLLQGVDGPPSQPDCRPLRSSPR